MATDNLVEISKGHGPNGFLEFNQCNYTVTDGKIAAPNGTVIGILYEDGLIDGRQEPFLGWKGLKCIEELTGCAFHGVDSQGVPLEIPSREKQGPTGLLMYNLVPLTVIKGRISTRRHKLVGEMDDDGVIYVRDKDDPSRLHQLNELVQLQTDFKGIRSNNTPLLLTFDRPLQKEKSKPYSENEIITYFDLDWHKLNEIEKQYVLDSLKMWTRTGWLQIVRKATGAGRAMFGNVRHGASGVTGVLTAHVTIDRGEFETEIRFFNDYGIISIHKRAYGSDILAEVRVNLVVSHEFGHQLEFTLSQATRDRIQDLYDAALKKCKQRHDHPAIQEGSAELLTDEQIPERCFISGYSRTSMHEYWAEALAAFSMSASREHLKATDPGIHDLLTQLVFSPEKVLSPQHQDLSLKLQASLRLGGELTNDLLAIT